MTTMGPRYFWLGLVHEIRVCSGIAHQDQDEAAWSEVVVFDDVLVLLFRTAGPTRSGS
jgi:hypothetical protein